jgi:beta-lactamase class A
LLLFNRREFLLTASTILPVSYLSARALQPEVASYTATDQLAAIETGLGGRLGVAILDTATGERIEHRSSERFPMCSTFKFLLVAGMLSRIDHKEEKPDRFIHYTPADLLEYAPITKDHVQEGGMTTSALCAAAIEYSDNTAANLLLNVIGGPGQLTTRVPSAIPSLASIATNQPSTPPSRETSATPPVPPRCSTI